jgi:anti-sigma B factor antagonist
LSHRPDLPEPFRVDVDAAEDGLHVRPVGELDLATADDLDARLRELHAEGHKRLVLDLSGLRFMDSTGLRILLGWSAASRADGFEFVLTAPPQHVQRVIALAGVGERLRFQ